MFPSFSSKMLQNGENDDFDDDFSMILGQLSNEKKNDKTAGSYHFFIVWIIV